MPLFTSILPVFRNFQSARRRSLLDFVFIGNNAGSSFRGHRLPHYNRHTAHGHHTLGRHFRFAADLRGPSADHQSLGQKYQMEEKLVQIKAVELNQSQSSQFELSHLYLSDFYIKYFCEGLSEISEFNSRLCARQYWIFHKMKFIF